jgi:hypothetical protein
VATKTGSNTSPKPSSSKPTYHGGPPGLLNVPQADKKAPVSSEKNGGGTKKSS